MLTGLYIVASILGAWLLSYHRARLWLWTLVIGLWLAFWDWLNQPIEFILTSSWIIFIILAVLLNVGFLRSRVLSAPLFRVFKRMLPAMSRTEKEALDAGTVWWEGEIFSGRPNWKELHSYPAPSLSPEERVFLDGPVEELCRMLDDWQITEELHDLPTEVWDFLKRERFFGMIIPKRYGGLEFSALGHSAVVTKISTRSVTAAVTVMVPNSLGPAELLLHYGTDEQRDYYLPRLADGTDIPCFALTSPWAGSDAAAMPDTGVVCKGKFQGKEVVGIRLNWSKRYITLGPVATVLGLAFKLYDPEHLIGDKVERGITCALIPTHTEGVEIGERHAPLNLAFMNGPNRGKDVFIPIDWIIGGPSQAGHGWGMLMESLAAGRSISLPSLSSGAGKMVSRMVGAYSRVREQFKLPIGKFEGVEEVLARIAGHTYAIDATREMTCAAVDMGEKPAVASGIAKYNLTERMRSVINDGMDVLGGRGICMGPNNFLARSYQAIPIAITVEGANILTRSMIVFGQGAIRCHPYVLKEMQAVANPDSRRGLRQFDKALFGHIGFTISNIMRSLFLGLTNARFAIAPAGPVKRYYQQISRMSAAFAMVSDLSMLVLGGNLKRKEKLSGRLADIFSQLYIATAALKRFEDEGRKPEDIPLVQWVCEDALFQVQESMHGLMRNFPNRLVAGFMRLMVFPRGRYWSAPRDVLGGKLASLIMTPDEARERLTRGGFFPVDPNDPMGAMEDALLKVDYSAEIQRKIRKALKDGELLNGPEREVVDAALQKGLIDQGQADAMKAAIDARDKVIQVDAFARDYWK
ncbi:MAG: acyl-CoA dehydrogenase [Gammaproteobacteria bacterium]|nr:acyl-CoA dehydrogenase [Gammaproteobacteria bacterium]